MEKRDWYFIPTSRVHEVFGKLERWSIIDLYRTARVLPSVAECVLENLRPTSVAKQVGDTPKNRWGVSYPIYEFLDEAKRSNAFRQRRHSHCRTLGIKEARFTDDFCERPSGFSIPRPFSADRLLHLNGDAVIRSEEEWLARCREQYVHTVHCGMYEDTDKAERVFECYKTIHSVLLNLWGYEIELVRGHQIHFPTKTDINLLATATGELLLAGQHHVQPVEEAMERWYQSPLVCDVSKIAVPTLD